MTRGYFYHFACNALFVFGDVGADSAQLFALTFGTLKTDLSPTNPSTCMLEVSLQ